MRTGLQVIQEIQDRLGDRQAETIEGDVDKKVRKLLRLLNRVLKNLVSAEQWPMLRTDGTIVTNAPVEEDMLVELTNGSKTVNISAFDSSGETFAENYVEWGIQFGRDTPIYRIKKVVSPTQIELNRPWLGDTVTPASADDDTVAVIMAMDRYAMPEDFDRPTGSWQDFLSAYNIKPLGPQEFAEQRSRRGRNIETDDPTHYTIYGLDPSNTYQVLHLEPWPGQQTLLQYDYQREHPDVEFDTDLVLFPHSQLSIVIEAVIYLANRDYKDDQRLGAALTEYLQQFNAAKSQQNVTSDRKQLAPWVARARSVRQTRGGLRIDYGDYFDVAGNTGLD
jgi:hypothetical protein